MRGQANFGIHCCIAEQTRVISNRDYGISAVLRVRVNIEIEPSFALQNICGGL